MKGIGFIFDLRSVGFEVDAYSGEVGGVEVGLAETDEYGAFADCLGTHYYDFKTFGFKILVRNVHIIINDY